ncbi:trehalase-like [Ziziphus jujuba]|uniref:Trehalase n=1 Tax=Ziziphus jujuba TaxID=326968 RepID=A0ABM4AB69_ZIZJJ|nr:trehalase-like [Ziziphus jujuba]
MYATLVLDQIWKIRNKAIFENATFSLEATMERLKTRFEETRNLANKKSVEVSAFSPSRSEWRNPPSQCIRINTDAAVKGGATTFFREVASAAESGWDFSTRWMRNRARFTTMATTSILPVDLNAFILGMELDIASLAEAVADYNTSTKYFEASRVREEAMRSVFWNAEMGQWLHYWLMNSACKEVEKWQAQNQNQEAFASNFVPLWIKSFYSDSFLVDKVMKSLKNSGLLCAAGVATSLTNSGEQWDFPNGWAPLQHMLVEGLARTGSTEAKLLAKDIAIRWIRTNYVAYKKTRTMHEKYNVEKIGDFGGGGEYEPQTGFGWSNGVVLTFLEDFGWPKDLTIDCCDA